MKEEDQHQQKYIPEAAAGVISVIDWHRLLNEPPGRFTLRKKILGFKDRFYIKFTNRLSPHVGKGWMYAYLHPSPSWRILLDRVAKFGLAEVSHPFISLPNDFPRMRIAYFPVMSLKDTDGHIDIPVYGAGGDSVDSELALSKALGELLERLPFVQYRNEELRHASMADLRHSRTSFLDLNELAGFSKEQKKENSRRVFDEHSQFRWIEGKSLLSGARAMLPAQLIFWNYHHGTEEPVLREPNTNGMGGHFTLTEALLSGIRELIQRDAFMVYWLNRLTPKKIAHRDIKNEKTKNLLRECERYGIHVHFLNFRSDFDIYSISAVLGNAKEKGSQWSMGTATSFDLEHALYSALVEALTIRRFLAENTSRLEYGDKPLETYKDKRLGQMERLWLWGYDKNFADKMEFLLWGEYEDYAALTVRQKIFASPAAELNYFIDEFKKRGKGYEIYYYERKTDYLKTFGYHAVHVVIPALTPLYLFEALAALGAERIQELPKKLDFNATGELNPVPHPFP